MDYTPTQIVNKAADLIAAHPDHWVSRIQGNVGLNVSGPDGGKWLFNLTTQPGVTPDTTDGANAVIYVSQELLNTLVHRQANPLETMIKSADLAVQGTLIFAIRFTHLLWTVNKALGG